MKDLTEGVADHLCRKLHGLLIIMEYENLCSQPNKRALRQLWEDIDEYTDIYMDEIWAIPDIFQPLKQN